MLKINLQYPHDLHTILACCYETLGLWCDSIMGASEVSRHCLKSKTRQWKSNWIQTGLYYLKVYYHFEEGGGRVQEENEWLKYAPPPPPAYISWRLQQLSSLRNTSTEMMPPPHSNHVIKWLFTAILVLSSKAAITFHHTWVLMRTRAMQQVYVNPTSSTCSSSLHSLITPFNHRQWRVAVLCQLNVASLNFQRV